MNDTGYQTTADIHYTEAAQIRDMLESLLHDIDAGKEPDGKYPHMYRDDRGRRMTLKLVRERLHHLDLRLRKLVKDMADYSVNK